MKPFHPQPITHIVAVALDVIVGSQLLSACEVLAVVCFFSMYATSPLSSHFIGLLQQCAVNLSFVTLTNFQLKLSFWSTGSCLFSTPSRTVAAVYDNITHCCTVSGTLHIDFLHPFISRDLYVFHWLGCTAELAALCPSIWNVMLQYHALLCIMCS